MCSDSRLWTALSLDRLVRLYTHQTKAIQRAPPTPTQTPIMMLRFFLLDDEPSEVDEDDGAVSDAAARGKAVLIWAAS